MLIPPIPSLDRLAEQLGLPKFMLTRYVFQADRHYKVFRIRKCGGSGYRIIGAPSKQLKGIQRWIMEFILRKVDLPAQCVGFREGRSILDNARPHVGKNFVLNVDIEDFFPSITIARVVGLFKSLGYSPQVAFALGKLTTYHGRLPQGAPSSPDIANIVCRKLDSRLQAYCSRRGWSYTRYADDMTVSGPGGIREPGFRIAAIIQEEGFELNPRKTRVARQNSRQIVTGIVVNRSLAIPRHRRRQWRAVFHQASLEPERFKHRIGELAGAWAFLRMVNPADSALPRYEKVLRRLNGP